MQDIRKTSRLYKPSAAITVRKEEREWSVFEFRRVSETIWLLVIFLS